MQALRGFNVQSFLFHVCRYEMLLYEKLQELGISYQSEDDLRAAGFSKTPDVKLDAPIGVRGRMVNWIDSKASFGDEHIHKSQGSDQFQRYNLLYVLSTGW